MTRSRLWNVLLALSTLLSAGIVVSSQVHVDVPADQAVTPEAARIGWVPADPAEIPDAPVFALDGPPQSHDNVKVKLSDDVLACTGGEHLPCYTQEVGDCVAHAVTRAVETLEFVQLARGPPSFNIEPRLVHRPFIYGTARCRPDLGDCKLNGDGCVVAWAVKAVQEYGVLPADQGPEYSGDLARRWGSSGVPSEYFWKAGMFRVKSAARVTTWDQAVDAIANGYPIPMGGQIGFSNFIERDGKLWGKRGGGWSHSMCIIGVDTEAVSPFDGREGALLFQNSWGPKAHGACPDNSPPGSFWVDRTTCEMYLDEQYSDWWAISNFAGFPARAPLKPDDFVLFSRPPVDVPDARQAPLKLSISEHFAHISPERAGKCGCAGCALSLLIVGNSARRRLMKRLRRKTATPTHTAA